MVKNSDLIMKKRTTKNTIIRMLVMIFGFLLLAINYNTFLVHNSLVIGGTSGLAIIINNLFGMKPSTFIYLTGGFLLLLSCIILGKKQTLKNVFGSILFPFCVSITTPLAKYLATNLVFDNFILLVLLSGILCGIADGLIFKAGFTTGGTDIIRQIINKGQKMQEGKVIFYINIIIILAGGIVFGLSKVIYAAIILLESSLIVDRILLGISENKMFFIYTKNIKQMKAYFMNDLKTGVTLFKTEGGFTQEKDKMIMCVVPTREYYRIKQMVLVIDPQAFIVVNDCYEVSGGRKKQSLLMFDNL